MSKNVKTYLLLGVVLLVWGIIGFKLINALSKESALPIVQSPEAIVAITVEQRDTFSIIADYRDPFLGTLPTVNKKTIERVVQKKPVSKRNIVYSGLVTQKESGNTMYFISIDGQQHIMSKSEEINGVKLLNGNGQSVRVRYEGMSETIVLQ